MTTDLPDPDGIFTVIFWKQAAERAVRAFAAGLVGTTIITTTGVSIDWKAKLLGAASMSATSLIFSLVGSRIGNSADPSLVKSTGGAGDQK